VIWLEAMVAAVLGAPTLSFVQLTTDGRRRGGAAGAVAMPYNGSDLAAEDRRAAHRTGLALLIRRGGCQADGRDDAGYNSI
jgi:hypothetical protein